MSADITTNLGLAEITSSTTYQNKTSISVLNTHATEKIQVQKSASEYIVLSAGQSVSLVAPTGSILPDITIAPDDTLMEAQVIAV